MVKWNGIDLKATPRKDFTLDEMNVSITSFKVTDSQYSKGGFINDGIVYDYKFDVSLTTEIDGLDGVADWGYVYKDPYGKIKRISLMQYGTSYTDTRYSYYRNESKSTACLYAYVKYEGDSEYFDDEPHDYPLEFAVHTCPDNNHPHSIDLGLPSGTKWSCCNVGASSPSDYGDYYAWGETTTKAEYTEETCKTWEKNLGDISGNPDYDAARANWGGSWRLPSAAELVELGNKCTWTWASQGGHNGYKVTGLNGNSIFLPAAGYRLGSSLLYAGDYGYYWSSTPYESNAQSAYDLGFFGGSHDVYWSHRDFGFSVRPVSD